MPCKTDVASTAASLQAFGDDGRAVALDMLIEPDAGSCFGQRGRERRLADLQWIAPQSSPFSSMRSKA